MSETVTDMFGQAYGVGDFVVYATVDGRSPVMKYARVEKLLAAEVGSWETTDRGREYVTRPTLKVGVREISNGRGFTRYDSYAIEWTDDTHTATRRVEKKVRVTYPMVENIVKVTGPKDD